MIRPLKPEELLESPPPERCRDTSDMFLSLCPTCIEGICTSGCTKGKAGAEAQPECQRENES